MNHQPDSRPLVLIALALAILSLQLWWGFTDREKCRGQAATRGFYSWVGSADRTGQLQRRPAPAGTDALSATVLIEGTLPPRESFLFFRPLAINLADRELLCALKGIGPVMAERILAHRDRTGPFQRPEDLLAIPGLGKKKLEKLLPQLSFD